MYMCRRQPGWKIFYVHFLQREKRSQKSYEFVRGCLLPVSDGKIFFPIYRSAWCPGSQTWLEFEEGWLARAGTTNSSPTLLVRIFFCQPRLSPELLIHKVSHAFPPPFVLTKFVVVFLYFLVNLPLARSGRTEILRRGGQYLCATSWRGGVFSQLGISKATRRLGPLSEKCLFGNKMGTHKCKKLSCGFCKLFRPQGTRNISETNQPSRPKATDSRKKKQHLGRFNTKKEGPATFQQLR